MKLLGIISMSFYITDQLPIKILAFVRLQRKIGNTVRQYISYVRFEVFTAVTMKNAVFWNVMPCDKNR
jgi:branched-subunit amino acid transport protein